MLTRRFALALALAAALPVAALARDPQGWSQPQFDDALEKGGPVLVHIDASWCPTCKAQKPILSKLLAEDRFKAIHGFHVDYDDDKKVMRALNAPDRSTILVFKGGKEVARSTGDTTEPAIAALLEKAL